MLSRILLWVLLISPLTGVLAERTAKPNVLFIVADDLCTHVGAYGDKVVQTPHLDALAARAVRFDRAYVQYPVCNPSRNSFLSGLRPDTTRIYNNETALRSILPEVVTLPQCFRESGYFTASISKIFHVSQWDPRHPEERPGSWKLDDARSWDFRVNTKPSELGQKGDNLYLAGAPGPGDKLNYRLMAEGDDDDQDDGMAVRDAIALLEQKRDRPFFLAVGFRRPHAAWIAPKRYFDLYPLASLHLPDPGSRAGVPALAFTNKEPNYGTPTEMLKMLQGYYASTTFMDAQLGRLLAALKRTGHADNTIIVMIGDHGWHLGEHGLWHKGSIFEESARAPLIIYAPGAKGNGQATRRIVEFVDLFPTLADLCGVPAPAGLAGVSLRPLLEKPEAPWSRPAFTQVTRPGNRMGRTVRTERWRYTEWDHGLAGSELYDHDRDPSEMINLAGDRGQADTVEELQRLLRATFTAH
ncbi:MAG: sulfatase [Opitutaceae bacterium]|nr:sulfatase [Opitutaceae bacterium]